MTDAANGAADVPPPVGRDADALSGWTLVESEVTTPFDAGVVAVQAHTFVYEDDGLRSAVRDRTGVDRTWRSFFASRVRLTPTPPRSRALDGLVARRARRGFADRLRARGFESVQTGERRRLAVGDCEATATRYDARCPVEGVTVRVEGWLAVWADEESDDYLLAGGAYPRELDGEGAVAFRMAVDPARFRDELFSSMRALG